MGWQIDFDRHGIADLQQKSLRQPLFSKIRPT